MNLFYRFFALLCLIQYCTAGPLVVVIVEAVGSLAEVALGTGEEVVGAVLGGRIGAAIGVGVSEVFFDQFVVVNGALYYGSAAVGAGALGGAAAGGVGGLIAVTQAALSKSIMSEKNSASMATASNVVASMLSVVSEAKSKKSMSSALQVSSAAARASVESQMLAPAVHDTAKDPFKFTFSTNKKTKRATPAPGGPVTTAAAAVTPIPPPPGTPVSSLPPDKRPTEVPAGVPEYNWRMCQNDIIRMRQNQQNLVFDQPVGQMQSLTVANIPSTCMVLSSFLAGDPALGPHPIVMGADKLQWDNIDMDTIHLIRQSFGVEPMNTTLIASVFGKKQ